MAEFLYAHPLIALFGVAACGFLLGKASVRGFSLGIAAVLFAGLALGACVPGLALPQFVPELGLVLFVYTLGLASGPGFFASLRLSGLRDSGLALGVAGASTLLVLLVARSFGLWASDAAGVFAGSLTNTPALAAVIDALKRGDAPAKVLAAPVIAYSVCYPMGVLLPMLAISAAYRLFPKPRSDGPGDLNQRPSESEAEPIINASVRIDRDDPRTAEQLRNTSEWSVVFGRIRHAGVTSIVHDETRFAKNDVVTVIGARRDVGACLRALGRISRQRIDLDRSVVDYRRMFVSNPELTARPLSELRLIQKYDAVITRVRRGDIDLVPNRDFTLQLGDRVRVLAAVERMAHLQKVFGDSLKGVAEIDFISFSLGIALGLLLGTIPIPFPGGGSFALGMAGGPLVAGLVLGRIGRIGPLVWQSPFGANLTLRQLGLVLFLAGVGIRSGGPLADALASGAVLGLFLSGAIVTLFSAALALTLGYRLGIPLAVLSGMVSGIHTQPAVLAFAVEKAKNDLPNVGYTMVFPVSTVGKIVFAQVLIHYY